MNGEFPVCWFKGIKPENNERFPSLYGIPYCGFPAFLAPPHFTETFRYLRIRILCRKINGKSVGK